MRLKRAVVTGPTGCIGANLIRELSDYGVEVVAVCRPGSQRMSAIPAHSTIKTVECSAQDISRLPELIGDGYDAFYHLAWEGTSGVQRNDLWLQERNLHNTLEAARSSAILGCKVFVGAGSQSEFGHIQGVLNPELPCKPDNGYGAAKLSAGAMSRVLCKELGISHCWCRILSVYGPHDGDHTMVMSLIGLLLNGERPKCTRGDQIWDYLYAKDAAQALRLVGEHGKDGAVYCLGSGNSRLLSDYILAIRDAAAPGADIGFGELPYYPNQVMHLEADITNLTNDTGFIPSYTFEAGIKETVQWVRDNAI